MPADLSPPDYQFLYQIMFSPNEQQYILQLARRSIEHYFNSGQLLKIEEEEELPSEQLKEERSCFVTLTIDGHLRGCIGHVQAVQPLYLDIIENAVAAAFDDARFQALTREEFTRTGIEVSVLTKPQTLDFSSPEELLEKLRPRLDGVIIRLGTDGATYLPQVWDDLPDKEQFLSSLCMKAGLEPLDWKKAGLRVWTYQTEKIK